MKLKAEVDKIDIDKLEAVSFDTSKLTKKVSKEVVKKTVDDKLPTKVNNIDTSGFVLKTKYDANKLNLEINPNTNGPVKKTDYNDKTTEIEDKIPSNNCLTTTAELTAVENKIPDVSNLVKNTDYNAKILDIEFKMSCFGWFQ